ncbi:VOC family protein [Nocardia sp. NPDC004151]|uniref:VOC family protein n=1 Tax=Nocardia sp. NPDC004151 TaxID=3364304 RepID=UPI0036C16C4C
MRILGTAIVLTVRDPAASSKIFCTHLGFRETVTGEDFLCLERDDTDLEIVLLQRDPESPPPLIPAPAGVTLSLTVADIAVEHQRLLEEGAPLTEHPHRAPGGLWLLTMRDPNGVEIQLTQWTPPSGA